MASLCTQSSIEQRGRMTSRVEDSSRPEDLLESCAQEFIGVAGRLNATAQKTAPADCNLIRTMSWRRDYSRSQKTKTPKTKSSTSWSRTTTNRMTTNQTNRNSRRLKYRPKSLSRRRSWMTTIRSYCQNRGDAKCRNCLRCACRRRRNRHGARRFLRHHASADYVRLVAAFVVVAFLAALCTAVGLDIFRRDSNHCGGNSGCRMSCFGAVQP